MKNTDNYKYYLSRNEDIAGGIRTVQIYKIGDEFEKEITYIRLPGGNFNISVSTSYNPTSPRGEEIDALEYETIHQGSLEAMYTFDRLFSYFDEEPQVYNIRKVLERNKVCEILGIPLLPIKTLDIAKPLLESIPWYSEGFIMITGECINYLKTLKTILSKDQERNSMWMLMGLENLISQINEKYSDLWGI